jgi:hypothetical protein
MPDENEMLADPEQKFADHSGDRLTTSKSPPTTEEISRQELPVG